MAKKSKTQRAKASANRAAKKQAREAEATTPVVEEAPKKGVLNKIPFLNKDSEDKQKAEKSQKAESSSSKKSSSSKASKPRRFGFFHDVRTELLRVTWPTKRDVLQWSGVVVVALIFFGVFVVVLDDGIVTPILLAISSLGA